MPLKYEEEVDGRERFGSRISFILAAVGSAVGFGNVWRFPALCASYGGGAFFVPYLLALFLIGIPILFLEIGLGQFFQTGDVGVFGSFNKRFRGVGIISVTAGFILLTYYQVLIAWTLNSFFKSWDANAPWDDPIGKDAYGYFESEVMGFQPGSTGMVWANVAYAALCWFITFLCIAFGVKVTGQLTYFTMGFPILMLFIFLGRGASLEGSSDGIKQYIGIWDFSVLTKTPAVWSEAVTQIFFSIGITFGTMTAYGSHCPRTEPAFLNSTIIAISNSMFSFLSGFAVFGAMGYLAGQQDLDVTDIKFGGFGLVFGTWPSVLATLPGGSHWVRLLFFDLFLLGIDSAFSILEAVIIVLKDTVWLKDTEKWKVTLATSVVGFICTLLYCSDVGLIWLDTVDWYINFLLLLVGIFETGAAGWICGMDKQIEAVGAKSVYLFGLANLGAPILGGVLWFGLKSVWPGFVGYILFYVIFAAGAHFSMESGGCWNDLLMKNILDLKNKIEPTIGYIPIMWCVLIKHFIPQVLIILFANLLASGKFFTYSGTYIVFLINLGVYFFSHFLIISFLHRLCCVALSDSGTINYPVHCWPLFHRCLCP
uniref:Transporter n=1 Tax=Corethron hystrix TaxID=216773 RepID=A0A7S1BHT6_9STRA|mmetsp:Transcript_25926/g.59690  ORF Transcript_25926/g.59690 Transcript_25926/m.59690 type:complete len:596 (+) Transcript_25926:195-1982(+)